MAKTHKEIGKGPVKLRLGLHFLGTITLGTYSGVARIAFSCMAFILWMSITTSTKLAHCDIPMRTLVALACYQGLINGITILFVSLGVSCVRCMRADMPKAYRSYMRALTWNMAASFVVITEMVICSLFFIFIVVDTPMVLSGNSCAQQNTLEYVFFSCTLIAQWCCTFATMVFAPVVMLFSCCHLAKTETKEANFHGRGLTSIVQKRITAVNPNNDAIDLEMGTSPASPRRLMREYETSADFRRPNAGSTGDGETPQYQLTNLSIVTGDGTVQKSRNRLAALLQSESDQEDGGALNKGDERRRREYGSLASLESGSATDNIDDGSRPSTNRSLVASATDAGHDAGAGASPVPRDGGFGPADSPAPSERPSIPSNFDDGLDALAESDARPEVEGGHYHSKGVADEHDEKQASQRQDSDGGEVARVGTDALVANLASVKRN